MTICTSNAPKTSPATSRSLGTPGLARWSEEDEPQVNDGEDGNGAHMDVQSVRKEPVAADPLSAGMRACGRNEGSGDDECQRARDEHDRQPVGRERRMGLCSVEKVVCAEDDDDRDGERDEGEEEVGHDDERVQLDKDGDAAEDPLEKDGHGQRPRGEQEPAGQPLDASRPDRRSEGHQADEEADTAVPELDERVVVLRR